MTDQVKPVLHLVRKLVNRNDINWASMLPEGIQWELFDVGKKNLIAFVEMAGIDEFYFMDILSRIVPHIVIDVRGAPIFDIGNLNRKKTFEIFKNKNIAYFEANHLFNSSDLNASQESYVSFNRNMKRLADEGRDSGPIILLVQDFSGEPLYLRFLPKMLEDFGGISKWDAYALPSTGDIQRN